MTEDSKLFHLVYISKAIEDFSKQDLNEILSSAQRNNLRLDITGILVFGNGKFMQFLEGSEFNVMKVFSSIKRDFRHHNIDVLRQEAILNRQFNDWRMRLTNPGEISVKSGVIYEKLFSDEGMTKEALNSAAESNRWLLAFKNVC